MDLVTFFLRQHAAVHASDVSGHVFPAQRIFGELNDDQMGTVTSMELNPAKARVLLQLALLKTKDTKQIQDYFDRY